jgi:hypothetical protein
MFRKHTMNKELSLWLWRPSSPNLQCAQQVETQQGLGMDDIVYW